MIKIRKLDDQTFEVTGEDRTTTTHRVTVTPKVHRDLTGGEVSVERLIEASFEFLLARESNTSILRSFDLPAIGRYFPEYEQTIRERLA